MLHFGCFFLSTCKKYDYKISNLDVLYIILAGILKLSVIILDLIANSQDYYTHYSSARKVVLRVHTSY